MVDDGNLTWEAVVETLARLPANPVAPENRGVARLHQSPSAAPGTILRIVQAQRPVFLLHPQDYQDLIGTCAFGSLRPSDQWLADLLEQFTAEQEARGAR